MHFVDIKISGIDKKRSFRLDQSSDIWRIYLSLSPNAPIEWCNCFEEKWQTISSDVKRKAWCERDAIVIECVPDEIPKYHLALLKEAVAKTNLDYKASKGPHQCRLSAEEEKSKADLASLDDLDFS